MSEKLSNLILIILSVTGLGHTADITNSECRDLYPGNCKRWKNKGYCTVPKYRSTMQRKCRLSCDLCAETTCNDLVEVSRCKQWSNNGLCSKNTVANICSYTCNTCPNSARNCPVLQIKHGKFERNTLDDAAVNPPKTDIHSVTQPGDKVSVLCNPGFQLKGNSTVTCQDNGKYDQQLGVCVRNDECQVPKYDISYEGLDRYYLVSEEMDENNIVPPGTFAILVCQNGRKLQSYCSGFGEWLPPLLECNDDTTAWDRWYPSDESNLSKRHLDRNM